MKCDRCKAAICEGEDHEHLGQCLCEDCYMDMLSPVKTCDPWAVHCARSFENLSGGQTHLTDVQKKILSILKETGGLERHELLRRMGGGFSDSDLTRAFAALRHMEKARAEKRSDKVFLRIW
jgi:hypothetical protein